PDRSCRLFFTASKTFLPSLLLDSISTSHRLTVCAAKLYCTESTAISARGTCSPACGSTLLDSRLVSLSCVTTSPELFRVSTGSDSSVILAAGRLMPFLPSSWKILSRELCDHGISSSWRSSLRQEKGPGFFFIVSQDAPS